MSWSLHPADLWEKLKREWMLYHLGDQRFRFMWDEPPADEWVALDCETTGLNVSKDDIIAIGAVRIRGNRVMASERLELLVRPQDNQPFSADSVKVHRLREQDVAQGMYVDDAMMELMRFIGSRPIVGYYLEFDVAMINRVLFPMLGMGLPQQKIEVSGLYYDYKYRNMTTQERDNTRIDLRFDHLMEDLNLPVWPAHDALNDAMMAALAFLKLRQLK